MFTALSGSRPLEGHKAVALRPGPDSSGWTGLMADETGSDAGLNASVWPSRKDSEIQLKLI